MAITTPEPEVSDQSISLVALASSLVDSGRFVPGLDIDEDERARSWWWPMPAATDRAALSALLDGDDPAAHDRLARDLAELVDTEVRARIVEASEPLVARRPGRRTVPDSWLYALGSPDPYLSASLNADKVRALRDTVNAWVRTGRPVAGRARLCLRIVAPELDQELDEEPGDEVWSVELLVQDADDPSLIVSIADLWDGTAPLGTETVADIVGALGHLDRIAPELSSLLDQAEPVWCEIDPSIAFELLQHRLSLLSDIGIAVLTPKWWTERPKLGMRMKASSGSSSSGATTSAGLGIANLVKFRWEAALGDEKLTKRDLAALQKAADAKHTIVRFRGEWIEVTPEVLAAMADLAGSRGEMPAGDVLKTSLGLGDDGSVPEGVEVTGVDATGWLGELLDNAMHAAVEPVPTPDDFNGELRPYQERGVGWLSFLGSLGLGSCLADDMGLGKTAQVIASLLIEETEGPTLVVCPVSVLNNWRSEIERFAPRLSVLIHHGSGRHRDHEQPFAERAADHDVVLTTYSLVNRDLEDLAAVDWARFVLDEAQNVKNPAAKQTRAVQKLRATRRVALTGTPVENNLSELWSIMHLLNPGLLGNPTSFRRRFAIPIEREHDEQATDTLRTLTGPFLLRRLKSDKAIISDLPDKIEMTDHCPLTREQVTLYQAVVDDLIAGADATDGIERRGLVLAGLLRLKQVCNHPAQYLDDSSALAGRSGKLNRVEEVLDELLEAGEKALCFTQFRQMGDRLEPYFRHRFGIDVAWLHGGVRRKKRDEMVEWFSQPDGPPVFLISLKAGGTGLNLTAASHVIHFDRWWNPAVEDQATDRAYRIGQQRNVVVHKLVSAGTVEERIDALLISKRDLADRVVGSGEDWITGLSTDELADLVALRTSDLDDTEAT